jgi:hypothetical protein
MRDPIIRRNELRSDVDCFSQLVRRHVDDELAGVGCVLDTVLAPPRARKRVRGKHHVRRVVSQVVELTEWRKVDDAVEADRRDPADRPRYDD